MKKSKRVLAAITTVAVSAVSFCSMFTVNAVTTEQYHTYRLYAELEPASSLKKLYLYTTYLRYGGINKKPIVMGDIPGVYDIAGSVNDNYITNVDIFTANNDLVNGGTLFRWEVYTKLNDSPENILRYKGCDAINSANVKISSDFIKVYTIRVGDINQNGVVDWDDVSEINSHLSGQKVLTGNPLRSADTNNDGVVNYSDLSILINYVNGSLDHF